MSARKGWQWARSSFTQSALLMAATLLIAQTISFFLLVNERQRAGLLEATGPSLTHFATLARSIETLPADQRHERAQRERSFDRQFVVGETNPAERFEPDAALKQSLRRAFSSATQKPVVFEAYTRQMRPGEAPFGFGWRNRPWEGGAAMSAMPPRDGPGPWGARTDGSMPFRGGPDFIISVRPPGAGEPRFTGPRQGEFRGPDMREIVLAVQYSDGTWLAGAYRLQRPPVDFLWRLAGSFLTIYVLVLGAALFIAYRLSRPFSQLARAAEQVGRAETPQELSARGPEDVQRAVEAFNAMTARVSRLLEEKDRFLGAIGHDLRTPIASLRIRAEALEPESERIRTIETLDEMTLMLEDILELARAGRSSEEVRLVDLSAFADTITEEFRDMAKDVSFLDSPRAPVFCRKNLTARVIRNLIENAVKFGVRVRVRVEIKAGRTVLIIDDDGPGIPAAELDHVRGAFVRLETSRNRDTGGAGLGLSIASAIAESQGAQLDLENRSEGGLSARVSWPSP